MPSCKPLEGDYAVVNCCSLGSLPSLSYLSSVHKNREFVEYSRKAVPPVAATMFRNAVTPPMALREDESKSAEVPRLVSEVPHCIHLRRKSLCLLLCFRSSSFAAGFRDADLPQRKFRF